MSKHHLRVPTAPARHASRPLLGAALLALALFGCALEHGARVAGSSEGGGSTEGNGSTGGGDTSGGGSPGGGSPAGGDGAWVPLPAGRGLLIFEDDGPTALLPHSPPRARHFLGGRVSEQGRGLPAHLKGLPDFKPERVDEYRYLRIRGDSRSWTIALRGVKSFGIKDRSPVFASLLLEEGEFEPTHVKLTLHAVDTLTFYYELGAGIDSLQPPLDLSIKQGRALCANAASCAAGASYTLQVHDNAFANDAEISPFEEQDVGPYHVVHAGSSERRPRENADCGEAAVGRTQVLAYLREPVYNPHGCPKLMTSTAPLPGADFGFASRTPCKFNLKQAALGITVAYDLYATTPIAYLTRDHSAASMCTPADDLPADVIASERVAGNGQSYEPRATGPCEAPSQEPVMLEPGLYTHIFRWDPASWRGSRSAPLAPGVYTMHLMTSGQYALTPESQRKSYAIGASMEIELVR